METRITTGSALVNAEGTEVIDFKNNQFEKYKKSTVPLEACDGILEFLDSLDLNWEEGKVRDVDIDYRVRRSDIAWVDDEDLKKYLWSQFVSANESDPDWHFDIDSMEHIQYTVYKMSPTPDDSNPLAAQSGHYEWHSDLVQSVDDNQIVPSRTRKLSMTLVLNDGWEGCEFECGVVKKGNLIGEKVSLGKGDIIVFPSIMHHRVNPILSGERKVLVAWAWGPLFK